MKTDFTVKNFKVFDEEGATFHLEPITILTGCNSSGKSSMTRALQLLSLFIGNQSKENYSTSNLSFGYFNNELKLGNFASLRNNKSASDGTITLSYSYNNFVVDYIFKEKAKGDNGSLSEIIISKDEEEVLHVAVNNGEWVVKSYHLAKIKDCLFSLLYGTFHWDSSENFDDFCERVFKHYDSRFNDYQFNIDGRTAIKEQEYRLKQIPKDQYPVENWSDTFKNKIINGENYRVSPVQPFDKADWVSFKDFVDGFISRSLFYLPVFDLLKDVDKVSTRTVLKDWLDKSKLKNEEQNSFKEFVHHALSFILEDFERSDYQTFIEYYVAKEDAEVWSMDSSDSSTIADIAKTGQRFSGSNLLNIGAVIKKKTFEIVDEAFLQDMARGNVFDENWEPIEPYFDKLNNSFEFIYHTLCWCCDMVEETSFVLESQGKCVAKMDEETNGKFFGEKSIEHPKTDSRQICLRNYFEDFFVRTLMQTLLFPEEIINLQYVNSSRAEIERVYDMKQSDSFGKLAKRFKEEENRVNFHDVSFINNWVRAFRIGEMIRITNAAEGGFLKIEVVKNACYSDDDTLLADEGYGITQLLSIILEIQTAIYNQTHPTIIIEEPEIHLHPKYQSLLAEMFLDAYKNYGIHFIIETHSEYLIRRFQTLVAQHGVDQENGLDRKNLSIYYLYSPLDGDRPKEDPIVKEIRLRSDGTLKDKFGTGFVDESEKLVFDLLDISLFKRPQNDNTANK